MASHAYERAMEIAAEQARAEWRVRILRALDARGLVLDATVSDSALRAWATELGEE